MIFNFIDPEAAVVLKDLMLNSQVEMMRNFGAPEESIVQIVEEFEKQDNMFSMGNVLQSLAFQLVGFSIVGLIAALIMKKSDENIKIK